MEKTIDVSITPYIPLLPETASKQQVNRYFSIVFRYGRAAGDRRGTLEAYQTPVVTITGFVKEQEDTSAVFNCNEEFEDFVKHLQFDDRMTENGWKIEKPPVNNVLKIIRTSPEPLEKNFVCSFHSIEFHPTNPKGEDRRAVLTVKAEGFLEGVADEYEITADKIYIPEILMFQEAEGKGRKNIGEEFVLQWMCRGDLVNGVQLQADNEEPIQADAEGSLEIRCQHPAVYKLSVWNGNPEIRSAAAAYVSIDVNPPEIKSFTAEKRYAYENETVTLSWETVSAYDCQINGKSRTYEMTGTTAVTVNYMSDYEKRTASFRLTAYGYKGRKPFEVWEELQIYRTFWKEEEERVKGIDLSGCQVRQSKGIFYDGSVFYLFDGRRLYAAENGLDYKEKAELLPEMGYSINSGYQCTLYNGKFYVAGIQSGDDMYIERYFIEADRWELVWASSAGERFLNGCFAPDYRNKRLYYIFFVNDKIYIYEEIKDNWGLTGSWEFEKTITACDCCCRENRLYVSLSCRDKAEGAEIDRVETYSIFISEKGGTGEIVKESVIEKKEGLLTLVATDNRVLLLGEQGVYEVRSGKKVDICRKDRVLAGMGDMPVMICRTKQGNKLYRLEEMNHD